MLDSVLQLIAVVTYITIDIIRIDSIATLLGSILDALLHDVANVLAPKINPFLVRPPVHRLAQISFLELVFVITPVLPRSSTEIADDLLPSLVQRRKRLSIVVVEVQIIYADIGLEVLGGSVLAELERLEKDDLPGGTDLWLP